MSKQHTFGNEHMIPVISKSKPLVFCAEERGKKKLIIQKLFIRLMALDSMSVSRPPSTTISWGGLERPGKTKAAKYVS